MTGRFPYKKLTEYPHLAPGDVKLWERFIDAYPDEYQSVDYDEHIGEGVPPPLDTPPNEYTEDVQHLTKKRMDVCGYRAEGTVDCIEVRPRAGSSAVGAVLINHRLFQNDHMQFKCRKLLITDHCQPDIKEFCAINEVRIVELNSKE